MRGGSEMLGETQLSFQVDFEDLFTCSTNIYWRCDQKLDISPGEKPTNNVLSCVGEGPLHNCSLVTCKHVIVLQTLEHFEMCWLDVFEVMKVRYLKNKYHWVFSFTFCISPGPFLIFPLVMSSSYLVIKTPPFLLIASNWFNPFFSSYLCRCGSAESVGYHPVQHRGWRPDLHHIPAAHNHTQHQAPYPWLPATGTSAVYQLWSIL